MAAGFPLTCDFLCLLPQLLSGAEAFLLSPEVAGQNEVIHNWPRKGRCPQLTWAIYLGNNWLGVGGSINDRASKTTDLSRLQDRGLGSHVQAAAPGTRLY